MGWVVMSGRELNGVEVLAQVNGGRLSVDTYEFPDRRIQVRHNGIDLPCTIFDPHQQCVTHAAITDSKHLSAVLPHIKVEQDKAAASAELRPESARNGYRKNGRHNSGWNSLADRKRNAARKASQGCGNLGHRPVRLCCRQQSE